MFIRTNSILSFTTILATFQVAFGAVVMDMDPFGQPFIQKRADVSYVWTLANGDIAPVRILPTCIIPPQN